MSTSVAEGSDTDESMDNLALAPIQGGGRRSKVWEHFERDLVNVDGDMKGVCKYCQLKMQTKSGTSSLLSHIAVSCPAVPNDVRKSFVSTMRKQPSDGDFVFDPQLSREKMVNFCIHAEIPFLKFEDPHFQPWMDTLQPTYKCIGRHTIRSDALKKYKAMKLELQVELENLDSRVCITTDMWTSVQKLGYMAVTAHYIDAGFNYKKKTIAFKEVKYPHTGYAIEEAIVSCLTEWRIRSKLFTVTVDNASNNTAACQELVSNYKSDLVCEGEHLHVRCCAHILNILVQDGMVVIHAAVSKTRELLKYIDSSPSRMQSFNALAVANGMRPKSGLYLDIPNRWNSTFKMLREALEYKAVLNSYAKQNAEVSPNDGEWTKAESICEFLKAFEELTNVVSAHREPTAHKFMHVVLCIRNALKDPCWQPTPVLRDLAVAMHSKLDKYWDPFESETQTVSTWRKSQEIEFNLALVIATVLDPTKKEEYLDFFYLKVANNMDRVPTLVSTAIQCMRRYYEEYKQAWDARSSDPTHPSSEVNISVNSPIAGKRKLDEEFARHKKLRRRSQIQRSELDVYLEEPTEDDSTEFNILAWLKNHAEKFPILASMARDFFSIPLSTVASESAFSCGGRLLGESRSSLDPEMLEALVCTKDWLYKQ